MTMVREKRKRATYRDIARLAEVHPASVSRALNDLPTVSPEIRERVIDAAQALNYRTVTAARNLRSQRTETIGLITEIETESTHYGSGLLRGVSRALTDVEFHLKICSIHCGASADELASLPLLRTISIDGVILDGHQVRGNVEGVFGKLEMPYIWVNPPEIRQYNAVIPDDVAVARRATRVLIEHGHRKIAYLPHARLSHIVHHSQSDRMRGYIEAMTRAGLPPIPTWDEELKRNGPDDPISNQFDEMVQRIRSFKSQGCTAMVFYSGFQAATILFACAKAGLKVPEEMSLIACDFDSSIRYLPITVTTMNLDRAEMGKLAVKMLQQRIENENKDLPSEFFQGELMEGETVLKV